MAVLGVAMLLSTAGCEAGAGKRAVVAPSARLPDPCALISDALARDLVAASSGVRRPADPGSADCVWEAPETKDLGRKVGTLAVLVTIQRAKIPADDPFLGAKAAYRGLLVNQECRELQSRADESCWFLSGSAEILSVALREGHLVVLVSCTGRGIPAIAESKRAHTAQRLAAEVLSRI
jgi:hypothetical protein